MGAYAERSELGNLFLLTEAVKRLPETQRESLLAPLPDE